MANISTVSAQVQSVSPFKVQAFAIDTIAGFPVHIYSSKTIPDKNVTFKVYKPSGTIISVDEKADQSGIAEFDLDSYHTKKAGEYKVTATTENGQESAANKFIVYADEVSTSVSQINASKLLAKSNGLDKVYITVLLCDEYKNPITNHSVELISSRTEDKINKITTSGLTDSNGEIMFSVSSTQKGVSVYSAIDTITNNVLSKRLEIAFTGLDNAGGYINTAYAAAGEVSKLVFEDLPSTIQPNSDISFTLTAYDSEDVIVPNYAGRVHFSAEGSNSVYAKLPNDYTFDIDLDAGSHRFSGANSLNFAQAGTYKVIATDLDIFVSGHIEIVVGTGGSSVQQTTTTTSTDETVITSPISGTYSDKRLPIQGVAPNYAKSVQIFNNDQNIGSTTPQSDGSFSYQPTALAEGLHKIFATALDADDLIISTSATVQFTIDTTPPELINVKFTPSKGIKTGDVIDITVMSGTDVYQGAVVFNIDIAELEQDLDNPTHYIASIQAPSSPGTYPISVILVDELGNEGSYDDVATVEVSENGDTVITTTGDEPVDEPAEEEPPADAKPGDVFGVRAESSDQKVTLFWQSATDDTGIKNYKIYYGLTPVNLSSTVETWDARTTWYIPNLQNGNEYYFAVSAIDTAGQESSNKSSIVNAIPFSQAVVVYTPPEPVVSADEVRPTAPSMQATGPEILWFALLSVFLSQLYFKFRRKMC
ncbi:Ig-like domain-containing protein [Candidatus Peregrinibacteria bacterium]|nr:Ig-like domain-containing protein [Candidatus Peregrinibacteria bacterium]